MAATRRRLKQAVWSRLQPFRLTPQQFWVLRALHRKGPQSLHALAREVWMDDPTASRVVKALRDRNLLCSEPDPGHGRKIRIRLAAEGLRMMRDLEPVSHELRTRLTEGLSPEEQEVVRGALTRMIANLEEAAEPPARVRRASTRTARAANL